MSGRVHRCLSPAPAGRGAASRKSLFLPLVSLPAKGPAAFRAIAGKKGTVSNVTASISCEEWGAEEASFRSIYEHA
jgi:hypothetical protein